MSEAPQAPQQAIDPQTNGNAASSLESAKNTVVSSAQSAMSNVQNHPVTQNLKDGPVGQTVQEQSEKTHAEFQDLANSKQTPEQPAATGQPLTHYHSLFYRLLSWKNPRATAIAYVSANIFIFLTRYLHIMSYVFKGTYTVLGITAAAEIVGHFALGEGLTSKVRPKKYFVIQRESMERFLDDIEQLTNFFVIESQRVLFAENVYATVAAFVSAFLSYWAIKFLPLWGLSLISVNVLFLAPLIYTQNKELIDSQLANAHDIVNKQTVQARDIAGQYTSKAQQSVGAYTKQAHEQISGLMGQKGKPTSTDYPQAPKTEPLPTAPKVEPTPELRTEGQEQVAAAVRAYEDRIQRALTDLSRSKSLPLDSLHNEIMEPEMDAVPAIPHTKSLDQLLADASKEDENAKVDESLEVGSTFVEPPSLRTSTEILETNSDTGATLAQDDEYDDLSFRGERRNST